MQFSLVPFAASVNVGPENAGASWMDVDGLSPVHQENFDWSTINAPDKRAEKIGGIWYKKGTGWGEEEGQMLTRFSLYRDMKVVTSHERVAGSERVVCDEYRSNHTCKRSHKEYDYVDTYGPFASWQGCVEARPYPYNTTDAPASGGLEQHRHRLRRSGDHVRADVRAGRARQPLVPDPGSGRSTARHL